MSVALLLVDLQADYLAASRLVPSRGEVVERAARLLRHCRATGLPIVHVWTTVRREPDRRMPHWRRDGRWHCLEGSAGHATPDVLAPLAGEEIVHKTHFSAFSDDGLAIHLRSRGVVELWLAGVHLHGCVRATAIDAYRLEFDVVVAADAVASDQPVHADETRRYLAARLARFVTVGELCAPRPRRDGARSAPTLPAAVLGGEDVAAAAALGVVEHVVPSDRARVAFRLSIADAALVDAAVTAAHRARRRWSSTSPSERIGFAERLVAGLEASRERLARMLAIEVGKPIADARGEVDFAAALVRAAAERAREVLASPATEATAAGVARRVPIGTVALITPWNVPLAIPLGKIVPALLYGNTVVWKPAPAGSGVALEIARLLVGTGGPADAVALVCGDHTTAEHLMSHPLVDAASLTGSSAAGSCAQAVCATRRIPLQAELGGNNAAIVWSDCDLDDAATKLAAGAFGFAGQRCTANRRMIVDHRCLDQFLARLLAATGALGWGDPLDPATRVSPLVSDAAAERVEAVVDRAQAGGARLLRSASHVALGRSLAESGAYVAPAIVCCDDPAAEVVQQETFGPVAVVSSAPTWEEALERLNRVPHGLVAALFTASEERRQSFLDEARAGVLKIGASTAGVGATAPFGGWKASGVGPPEHGSGDVEFFTRAQAVYLEAGGSVPPSPGCSIGRARP